MKETTYNINGRLELQDDTSYTYIVKDGDKITNLSEILNGLSNDDKKLVYIVIECDGHTVISLRDYERLYITPDGDNVKSWMLGGENIDLKLFDHVGDYLTITIKVRDTEASK